MHDLSLFVTLLIALPKEEFIGMKNALDMDLFIAFFRRVDTAGSTSGVCKR